MGSVQVSYEKEYRYYTEILVKVQQDLKDAKITTSTVIYQGKVIPELEEPEDEDEGTGPDGLPKKPEDKKDVAKTVPQVPMANQVPMAKTGKRTRKKTTKRAIRRKAGKTARKEMTRPVVKMVRSLVISLVIRAESQENQGNPESQHRNQEHQEPKVLLVAVQEAPPTRSLAPLQQQR